MSKVLKFDRVFINDIIREETNTVLREYDWAGPDFELPEKTGEPAWRAISDFIEEHLPADSFERSFAGAMPIVDIPIAIKDLEDFLARMDNKYRAASGEHEGEFGDEQHEYELSHAELGELIGYMGAVAAAVAVLGVAWRSVKYVGGGALRAGWGAVRGTYGAVAPRVGAVVDAGGRGIAKSADKLTAKSLEAVGEAIPEFVGWALKMVKKAFMSIVVLAEGLVRRAWGAKNKQVGRNLKKLEREIQKTREIVTMELPPVSTVQKTRMPTMELPAVPKPKPKPIPLGAAPRTWEDVPLEEIREPNMQKITLTTQQLTQIIKEEVEALKEEEECADDDINCQQKKRAEERVNAQWRTDEAVIPRDQENAIRNKHVQAMMKKFPKMSKSQARSMGYASANKEIAAARGEDQSPGSDASIARAQKKGAQTGRTAFIKDYVHQHMKKTGSKSVGFALRKAKKAWAAKQAAAAPAKPAAAKPAAAAAQKQAQPKSKYTGTDLAKTHSTVDRTPPKVAREDDVMLKNAPKPKTPLAGELEVSKKDPRAATKAEKPPPEKLKKMKKGFDDLVATDDARQKPKAFKWKGKKGVDLTSVGSFGKANKMAKAAGAKVFKHTRGGKKAGVYKVW